MAEEHYREGMKSVQATLKKKQTEVAKENRTSWKKARVQEQEERKQWICRQRIQHTYGSDDEEDSDDDLSDSNEHHTTSSRTQGKCKCGSTTHRDCPLNKRQQVKFEDESATRRNDVYV